MRCNGCIIYMLRKYNDDATFRAALVRVIDEPKEKEREKKKEEEGEIEISNEEKILNFHFPHLRFHSDS